MRKIFSLIETVAPTDAAVCIGGETGTGKELMARAIHLLSCRYQGPFVAINCAALPRDLVEAELFGHEKGAFTGAIQSQIGAFEAAHQGTLFLDEIGELDLGVQAKLLRALESGEVRRLGSSKTNIVSVRIISATHRNLLDEMSEGRFREDLFYRLHIVPISIPPLRDRVEDLNLLIAELFSDLQLDYSIDPGALEFLKAYKFPGNIRELKNILQRAAVEAQSRGSLSKILNTKAFQFLDSTRPIQNSEELQEKQAIRDLLEETAFNQSEVARRMGLPVSTLHDRVKRYGLIPQGKIRARSSIDSPL